MRRQLFDPNPSLELPQKRIPLATKGVISVAIIAITAAVFFWVQWRNAEKKNPEKIAEQETADLLEAVGALIMLPNEEPSTVATVKDLEALKDQVFFKNARVGDKLLIYTNEQKAILYRPSENKLIEVSPLNIGGE